MGKSLGNVLEPRSLIKAYGADAVRFYFLKEIVFGQVLTPHNTAQLKKMPVRRLTAQHYVGIMSCTGCTSTDRPRVQDYHCSSSFQQ